MHGIVLSHKRRASLYGVLPLHHPFPPSLQTAAQHHTPVNPTLPEVHLVVGALPLTSPMLHVHAVIISDLVDELEEAEDDLDLAEEYVSRIANVPTMADLTGMDDGAGAGQQGGK